MTKPFSDCWNYIVERSKAGPFPVVQDRSEMEHVYTLLQGCESYLEVGSAEGNSLYVFANAMRPGSRITYIDWDEKHTRPHRERAIKELESNGYKITGVRSNSNDFRAALSLKDKEFDCVLIDAGHKGFNVAIDAMFYAPLATKYIVFHDIRLPDVEEVFAWYSSQRPDCKAYRFFNSDTYGYGVMIIGTTVMAKPKRRKILGVF